MKWRFFRHLRRGGDSDAVDLYRWHIQQRSGHRIKAGVVTDKWKRSIGDYLESAVNLFHAVDRCGVLRPVPVDPDGELLDGAHRVACALALGLSSVPVEYHTAKAWAPAWDEHWFRARMTDAGVKRLLHDFEAMRA